MKMRLLPVLMAVSLPALPARADGPVTLGDLDRLQQQTLILQQQAKQAELQKKIDKAQGNDTPALRTPAQVSVDAALAASRPALLGIQGVKDRLTAAVNNNGVTMLLRAGDTWPGTAIHIRTVTWRGVTLDNGTLLNPGDRYDNQP